MAQCPICPTARVATVTKAMEESNIYEYCAEPVQKDSAKNIPSTNAPNVPLPMTGIETMTGCVPFDNNKLKTRLYSWFGDHPRAG